MANTTISPNMNMPVPTVGEDPGPDWATNLDACLSIIDSHNHTSGQGVPITPQGLNINADLPLNGNNLITARSLRFSPQSGVINGASDLGALYENGVDLYYVDGAGNQVRITQGGSVTGATGTITGLPSGTASAAFAGGTFTFQSATNTPAAMNFGPVTLGQAVASGKNVTISASGSQPANYNFTLPLALPSTSSALLSDASGNMSFTGLQYGTYAPVVTSGGSGSGQAALGTFFYKRIGNIVTVAGRLTIVTESGSPFEGTTRISLPFNPTTPFASENDVAGTTGSTATSTAATADSIIAAVGTNLASILLRYAAGGLTINYAVMITYSCA